MTDDQAKIPPGTGARIKARRTALGLTQAQVADRVAEKVGRNYRENWLAQIERGKASLLLNAAIALADVLTMSLDEMFGRTAYRGTADIVLEAPDEITQRVESAAVDPVVVALRASGTEPPTEPAPAPRGRRKAAARPPRT